MEIENYTKNGYEITIGYDDTGYMLYDEIWDGVTFISNHRDYSDKGNLSHLTIEHVLDKDVPEGYEIMPIHAYIHGGVSLSLGSFDCPWDSGVFGFIIFKTGEFGENNRGLESFIEYWQDVLNGNVYYFTISKDDEVLESVGGFVGYDHIENEVKQKLEALIKHEKITRQNKLKTLIKNRVPLHYRVNFAS